MRLYLPLAKSPLSASLRGSQEHRVATFTLASSPERGFQRTQEQPACRAEALAPTFRKERWGPRSPLPPTDSHAPGQESLPNFAGTSEEGLFAKCLHMLSSHSASGPLRCCGRRVTVLPWPSLALGFPCCPESWEDPAGSTRKDCAPLMQPLHDSCDGSNPRASLRCI